MNPKDVEHATEAGYTAAVEILHKLELTDEEIATALWAAVAAADAARATVTSHVLLGRKIRADKVATSALASALAGLSARDSILEEKKNEKPQK